jgi:hypothetical protein
MNAAAASDSTGHSRRSDHPAIITLIMMVERIADACQPVNRYRSR